jgi:hypothetical protein
MKIKFLFSLIVSFCLLTSCGLFDNKAKQFAEFFKNDTAKYKNKEWGLSEEKRNEIIKTGKKADGEITKVEDMMETFDNNLKVKLYVKVKPEKEDFFDAVVIVFVPRVKIPKEGDSVNVYYNPKNKKEITVDYLIFKSNPQIQHQ